MIYGHKWTSSYGDRDDGTWLDGLAGLAPDDIAAGLRRCVASGEAWPPSLPEFRAACGPDAAALGLPDVMEAWVCVCGSGPRRGYRERWRHPVVLHAASDRRLDLWSMRKSPPDKALRVWGPIYAEYVQRVALGERFDWPDERQLTDCNGKPVTVVERRVSKATAMAQLKGIRQVLAGAAAS